MRRGQYLALLLVVAVVVLAPCGHGFERGEAFIVLRVRDDAGEPVEGAEVCCTAWWPDSVHRLLGKDYGEDTSRTDGDGIAEIRIVAYSDMNCEVKVEGYYRTFFVYDLFRTTAPPRIVGERWQPWGQALDVILKRVRNPIAMYAKRLHREEIPVLGEPVAYDLQAGDWLEPHGKGEVPDLVFTVAGEYRGPFVQDLRMEMAFSNPDDGLVSFTVPANRRGEGTVRMGADGGATLRGEGGGNAGSALISDHLAPEEGYEGTYVYTYRVRPIKEEWINPQPRPGRYAYVRVRSGATGEGPLYGKIYGDLHCRFDRKGERVRVYFTYYLNPNPGDRNVEFDPSRNLFNWTHRDRMQHEFPP